VTNRENFALFIEQEGEVDLAENLLACLGDFCEARRDVLRSFGRMLKSPGERMELVERLFTSLLPQCREVNQRSIAAFRNLSQRRHVAQFRSDVRQTQVGRTSRAPGC